MLRSVNFDMAPPAVSEPMNSLSSKSGSLNSCSKSDRFVRTVKDNIMHTAADTQALPNWTVQLLEAGLQ